MRDQDDDVANTLLEQFGSFPARANTVGRHSTNFLVQMSSIVRQPHRHAYGETPYGLATAHAIANGSTGEERGGA